ncbi:hypothetical protein [Paenibacillus selenitireducens]|uniref:hypothetical protein n=1 Tax=Paenibacillus selenitireducens TaxID=1324314 RepID=UPI001E4557FB|nr:hypothetical protein [Paenibacillus selenitireducens]
MKTIMAKPWRSVFSPAEGHTITGDVRIIDNFYIPQLDVERRVWIYLPRGYEKSSKHYPVLYGKIGPKNSDTLREGEGTYGEADVRKVSAQSYG